MTNICCIQGPLVLAVVGCIEWVAPLVLIQMTHTVTPKNSMHHHIVGVRQGLHRKLHLTRAPNVLLGCEGSRNWRGELYQYLQRGEWYFETLTHFRRIISVLSRIIYCKKLGAQYDRTGYVCPFVQLLV